MKNFTSFRKELLAYDPSELMDAEMGSLSEEERIYRGGRNAFDDGTGQTRSRKKMRPKRKPRKGYFDENSK